MNRTEPEKIKTDMHAMTEKHAPDPYGKGGFRGPWVFIGQ